CGSSALTAAIAFGSVPSASGLGAPLKPQCVSESCTKKNSSCAASYAMPDLVLAQPRPDANTTPPSPAILRNCLRSTGCMCISFGGSHVHDRACPRFIPGCVV